MAGTTATTENLITVNRFDLEIDSVKIGQIISLAGISDSTEVADAPTTTNKGAKVTQKMAGNTTYGDLNFVVHATNEKYLTDWMKEVEDGKAATYRRNGSIVMFNTKGDEQLRCNFVAAFPSAMNISGFSAATNDAVTLTMTLVHEGLELIFKK